MFRLVQSVLKSAAGEAAITL